MARQQLIHIHSNVYVDNAPKAPSASYLEYGELAVNYNATEPSLFVRDSNDEIRQFHTSDVILSKAKLGDSYTIHDEVEDDTLLEITAEDTVVSSIGKLMRIIIDNEEVVATSLNDLNVRIEGISNSLPDFEELTSNLEAIEEQVDVIANDYKVREDYTPVVFEDLSDTDYTMTAVAANDTITDAVTKIDTNLSNIIDITLKNENTTAQAFNILNQRVVVLEESISEVGVDENYIAVEYRELPTDDVTFEPVVAGETLTQAVKKIDTNISQLVSIAVENEEMSAQAFNDLNERVSYLEVAVDDGPKLVHGTYISIDEDGTIDAVTGNTYDSLAVGDHSHNEFNDIYNNISNINDNINTISDSIDDLNERVDNIKATVEDDYVSVQFRELHNSDFIFEPVVASETLTQAVKKIDTNTSQLLDVIVENELVTSEALNVLNNEIEALKSNTPDELPELIENVENLSNQIGGISSDVTTISGSVETLNTTVSELSGDLETLSEKVDNIDVKVASDYTAVVYNEYPQNEYVFTAVVANDTLTQAVHKIDTNISQLIDATIDNEYVFATALNVLNTRVDGLEEDMIPGVVEDNYKPVTYPTIPDNEYVFSAVQPNNTITQAVKKIDTNLSNLVQVVIDNEYTIAEAYNTINTKVNTVATSMEDISNSVTSITSTVTAINDSLSEQINYFEGVINVTSLSSISIEKRLVICKVSSNGSFSLNGTPIAGREIHVMVNNNGSSDITISLPTASPYVNLSGDSITVTAGGWNEINVLSDGTNMFIRAL